MSYTIFQMPVSLWHAKQVIFNEYSIVERKDYCPVYQGELDEENVPSYDETEILEHLFEKFNISHPKHYATRSLSPGDVVMVDSGYESKYFLCCSIGWHELRNF